MIAAGMLVLLTASPAGRTQTLVALAPAHDYDHDKLSKTCACAVGHCCTAGTVARCVPHPDADVTADPYRNRVGACPIGCPATPAGLVMHANLCCGRWMRPSCGVPPMRNDSTPAAQQRLLAVGSFEAPLPSEELAAQKGATTVSPAYLQREAAEEEAWANADADADAEEEASRIEAVRAHSRAARQLTAADAAMAAGTDEAMNETRGSAAVLLDTTMDAPEVPGVVPGKDNRPGATTTIMGEVGEDGTYDALEEVRKATVQARKEADDAEAAAAVAAERMEAADKRWVAQQQEKRRRARVAAASAAAQADAATAVAATAFSAAQAEAAQAQTAADEARAAEAKRVAEAEKATQAARSTAQRAIELRETAAAAQHPATRRAAEAKARFLESEAAEAASWAEEVKRRLNSTADRAEQIRLAAAKAKMDAAAEAWQHAKVAAKAAAAQVASAE